MVQLLQKRNGKPRSSLYGALRDMGLCKARCRMAPSFNAPVLGVLRFFSRNSAVFRKDFEPPSLSPIRMEPARSGDWGPYTSREFTHAFRHMIGTCFSRRHR